MKKTKGITPKWYMSDQGWKNWMNCSDKETGNLCDNLCGRLDAGSVSFEFVVEDDTHPIMNVYVKGYDDGYSLPDNIDHPYTLVGWDMKWNPERSRIKDFEQFKNIFIKNLKTLKLGLPQGLVDGAKIVSLLKGCNGEWEAVPKNDCPHSSNGECELSSDDNKCNGAQSEQEECAYR